MQLSRKDFKVKTILVCVSRTWGVQKKSDILKKRVTLEDCARGYWRIVRSKKALQCECLMAVSKGEIVGVWEIDRAKGWMTPAQTPKRSWPEDKGYKYPRLGCEFVSPAKETPAISAMRTAFLHHRLCEIAGMDSRGGAIHYSF